MAVLYTAWSVAIYGHDFFFKFTVLFRSGKTGFSRFFPGGFFRGGLFWQTLRLLHLGRIQLIGTQSLEQE